MKFEVDTRLFGDCPTNVTIKTHRRVANAIDDMNQNGFAAVALVVWAWWQSMDDRIPALDRWHALQNKLMDATDPNGHPLFSPRHVEGLMSALEANGLKPEGA